MGCDCSPADPTPNCAALAGEGNGGVTADEVVAVRVEEAGALVDDFAPSDFPGRIAETRAASPAVRAAAATVIQRRVTLIRWSAASRSRTGSSRSLVSCVRGMASMVPGSAKRKVRIHPPRSV
jgi:hypothetical protein